MLRVFLGMVAGVLLSASALAHHVAFRTDALVRLLEMHFQVPKGVPVTIVECQCTLQYMGTEIRGKHYLVHIDKLD